MGFYGNITNTSNTTFQFDRIYPNRLSMDTNVNNDGIFIGRYVLIEYERKAAYPVVYTKVVNNNLQFYSSPNCEDITRIKFGTGNDQIDQNDIVKSYPQGTNETTTDGGEWPTNTDDIKFYRCIDKDINNYAIFVEITDENDVFGQKSDYILNYAIDENHYYPQDENERRTYKGYDSTVWTKVSETSADGKLITKYVNIADLNSVVPTFDIAADAPTMVPITPHFDADSTNVYYKLHMQTPFGFRVKENTQQSDQTTTHYETVYDKNGNITSQNKREDVKADIFYNKNALEYKPNNNTNRVTTEPKGQDEIKLTLGQSINYKTKYQHYTEGDVQGDIQELSIHLPSVGYMVSQGWDVIHGENRDDARTDDNDSLKGRLDSFKEIKTNQIPVKRATDGTLVGSKINNAIQYQLPDRKDILSADNIPDKFQGDDPWIETEINTENLVGGKKAGENGGIYDQTNNSGISIRHTFHGVTSSTTELDKNSGKFDEDNPNLQIEKLPITNKSMGINDKIKLYTPYVDAMGHVVGKNIETIVLPYGYKYFTTDGLSKKDENNKDIVKDLYSTVNNTSTSDEKATGNIANNAEAHNTQDTLTINPYNKWIQIKIEDTENDGDILTIAHEIHSIDERDSNSGDNESSHSNANKEEGAAQEDNLTMYDWTYDEAGHITSKRKHTYTLPFGFKTIQAANSSSSGEAPAAKDTSSTYNTNTTEHVADTTQDTLKFSATNKWITMQADTSDDVIKFGHVLSPETVKEHKSTDTSVATFGDSFNVLNFDTDEAGHIIRVGQTTITTPVGTFSDTVSSNNANVITSVAYTPTTGVIEVTHQDAGTLKLGTAYTTNKNGALTFDGESTINDALSAIQAHINESEYTESGNQYFIDSITQIDGKITTTRNGTAGTLIVGYDTTNKLIGKDDSVNTAFDTIDKAIAKEVSDRAAADTAEATARANADTTEKNAREAADNAEKLAREAGDQAERAALNAAIEQEVSDRDDAINAAIAGLVDSAPDNLNTLQKIVKWIDADEDGAIDLAANVAKNTEDINTLNTNLKSAAYETKETFVLKTDYDIKVASLEAIVLDLTNRITALEEKMEENHPTEKEETI